VTGTGPKCDRLERFRRNHQLARLGGSRRRPRKRSRAASPCLPAAPWAGEEPYDGHWPSRRARGAPPHPPGCHRPLINRRDGVTHLQPEPARRKRLSPSPIRAPTPGARSRSRKSRAARRDRLADQCPRQSVDHGRRPAHRRLSRRRRRYAMARPGTAGRGPRPLCETRLAVRRRGQAVDRASAFRSDRERQPPRMLSPLSGEEAQRRVEENAHTVTRY